MRVKPKKIQGKVNKKHPNMLAAKKIWRNQKYVMFSNQLEGKKIYNDRKQNTWESRDIDRFRKNS